MTKPVLIISFREVYHISREEVDSANHNLNQGLKDFTTLFCDRPIDINLLTDKEHIIKHIQIEPEDFEELKKLLKA